MTSVTAMITPKDGKGFLEEFEAIAKADMEYVDVGWFEEQGHHPTAVDSDGQPMTYPDLAKFHATGGGGTVPIRNILSAARDTLTYQDVKRLNQAVCDWIEDPTKDPSDTLLPKLGVEMTRHIMDTFGSDALHPTEGNPDPLIDTGEFMRHTAYKVKNGKVKEGGK